MIPKARITDKPHLSVLLAGILLILGKYPANWSFLGRGSIALSGHKASELPKEMLSTSPDILVVILKAEMEDSSP